MNDHDHYAFIECMLANDNELDAYERQALEQELADYYQCLAEQTELDVDDTYTEGDVYENVKDPATPAELVNACLDMKYSY